MANFRSTLGDTSGDALTAAWWEVLSALPWLDNTLFERAVAETLLCHLDYLPTVAQFVEVCRGEREEMVREARLRLPVPPAAPPPRRLDRAEWDRNVEIGRVRWRARMAALRATRASEAS